MNQYSKIEDAMSDLFKEHGIDILNNNNIFIALLSDYAPDLNNEQKMIRSVARANGIKVIYEGLKQRQSMLTLLTQICSSIVNAELELKDQVVVLQSMVGFLRHIGTPYESLPCPDDLFNEGMQYFRQFPKEKNIPIAILLFEMAGRTGNTDGLYYISCCFLKGKGVVQDLNAGIRYLEIASEKGNLRAKYELAERLWKGNGVEKDLLKSITLFRSLDDANATFNVGEIYREQLDYRKAFDNYLLAAQQGQVYAQYAVAIACATGQGTTRDMLEAKKWLKSAASLGHSEARKKLKELGESWD